MEEKKTFFASLSPKSALITGVVAGVLVLCTLGFIVLGIAMLASKSSGTASTTKTGTNTTVTAQQQQVPAKTLATITKADKPQVELFIMTYCPYGLQMQKAYLPVMKLLSKKASFDVKWVNYIMHDKKEIDENNVQYCIQKEQKDKYLAYAECFTVKGDTKTCLTSAKINQNKLKTCIASADKAFDITKEYNTKANWLSGRYPVYKVHNSENQKYGVQGSPTLVINGSKVDGISRNPEAVKQAVCASFKTQPAECKTTLSSSAATAGFGAGTGADTVGADCS